MSLYRFLQTFQCRRQSECQKKRQSQYQKPVIIFFQFQDSPFLVSKLFSLQECLASWSLTNNKMSWTFLVTLIVFKKPIKLNFSYNYTKFASSVFWLRSVLSFVFSSNTSGHFIQKQFKRLSLFLILLVFILNSSLKFRLAHFWQFHFNNQTLNWIKRSNCFCRASSWEHWKNGSKSQFINSNEITVSIFMPIYG